MLGDVPLTALIVAYHAVPNVTITSAGLAERGGDDADADDRFLDTALASVLDAASFSDAADAPAPAPGGRSVRNASAEPLLVDEHLGELFVKGVGSEAKITTRDLNACGSVVHAIDAVLLPIDGDAELEPFQKARLADIKARAEATRAQDEQEDTETSYADVLEEAAAPARRDAGDAGETLRVLSRANLKRREDAKRKRDAREKKISIQCFTEDAFCRGVSRLLLRILTSLACLPVARRRRRWRHLHDGPARERHRRSRALDAQRRDRRHRRRRRVRERRRPHRRATPSETPPSPPSPLARQSRTRPRRRPA